MCPFSFIKKSRTFVISHEILLILSPIFGRFMCVFCQHYEISFDLESQSELSYFFLQNVKNAKSELRNI